MQISPIRSFLQLQYNLLLMHLAPCELINAKMHPKRQLLHSNHQYCKHGKIQFQTL